MHLWCLLGAMHSLPLHVLDYKYALLRIVLSNITVRDSWRRWTWWEAGRKVLPNRWCKLQWQARWGWLIRLGWYQLSCFIVQIVFQLTAHVFHYSCYLWVIDAKNELAFSSTLKITQSFGLPDCPGWAQTYSNLPASVSSYCPAWTLRS